MRRRRSCGRLTPFSPRRAISCYYLPWEEYAFYFAQGILMCLLLVALAPPAAAPSGRNGGGGDL